MPKLKSVIAGLATGTALAGALVAGGATAAVAMPTAAPVVANDGWDDGFFGPHHLLLWGNGHHNHHKCGHSHGRGKKKRICVVVRNFNFNDNNERRRHHHHNGDLD